MMFVELTPTPATSPPTPLSEGRGGSLRREGTADAVGLLSQVIFSMLPYSFFVTDHFLPKR